MTEDELDRLLADAAKHWRVPAEPPLDMIWAAVERKTLAPGPRGRAPGWTTVGIAAAAALVVGVLGGRALARRDVAGTAVGAAVVVPAAAVPVPATHDPDQRALGDLLGRTAVLLAELPGDSSESDARRSLESARLLTTTRLLLDSPVAADANMRNLLQDLELVLAQVARVDPRHRRDDIRFIQSALDQHDIVPRLRSAAAELSLDGF